MIITVWFWHQLKSISIFILFTKKVKKVFRSEKITTDDKEIRNGRKVLFNLNDWHVFPFKVNQKKEYHFWHLRHNTWGKSFWYINLKWNCHSIGYVSCDCVCICVSFPPLSDSQTEYELRINCLGNCGNQ